VLAGLRRGWVEGELTAEAQEPAARGSRSASEQKGLPSPTLAVALLALGGAGGILLLLWPFFPQLLRLAPIGALLASAPGSSSSAACGERPPRSILEMVAAIGGEEDAAPLP